MDWIGQLRSELSSRAQSWAEAQGLPYYLSLGSDPTVLFETNPDGSRHGNFHARAWAAIRANPEWSRRLTKPHQRRSALPEAKQAIAKELDSANSSDALLMNCFCFPGVGSTIACRRASEEAPS